VPVTNPDAQQAAGKVLSCLLSEQNMLTWDTAHSLVPAKTAVAAEYGQRYPQMRSFIDEVATAKSRTAELGEKYQPLSTALGTAIQSALTGRQTPAQALHEAAKATS
jgi:multiple sugar transport system substrate-binding protein